MRFLGHGGHKLFAPAVVLIFDEFVDGRRELARALRAGPGRRVPLRLALLRLLQQAGHADFHEFVQIAGGDGQKFDALEKRIAGVEGLFEDAAVELQPGKMPVEKQVRILLCVAARQVFL